MLCNLTSPHIDKWVNYFEKNVSQVTFVSIYGKSEHFKDKQKFLVFDGCLFLKLIKVLVYLLRNVDRNVNITVHYLGYSLPLLFMRNFRKLILVVWGSDVLVNSQSQFKKNSSKLFQKSSVILFEGESTRQKLSLGAKEEKLTAIKFGVNALNPEKPLNNKKATSKHPSMHNVDSQ